jgi:protein-S-isoprenylcysteine O-methyltransferase Ste14
MNLVRAFPRVLFAVVLGVFAYALSHQIAQLGQAPNLLAAALTITYLAWLVAEVPVTFRRSSTPVAESRTLVAYGVARVTTAVAAVLGGVPWTGWSPWLALPVLAFVGGMALRLVATRVLGRFYSHHVIRRPDHQVVSSGPYRFVRHPAYSGMILAHVGFVAFFANPASILALTLLVAAICWRITVEERVMWTVPGYREYAVSRSRIVPGAW